MLAHSWDGGLKFCINKGGGGMSHLICDQGQTAKHTHDYKNHVVLNRLKRTCTQGYFRKSNQVVRITESKLAAGCEKFQDFIFLQVKVHIHPIPSNSGRV